MHDGVEASEGGQRPGERLGLVERAQIAHRDPGRRRERRLGDRRPFLVAGVQDDAMPLGEELGRGSHADAVNRAGNKNVAHEVPFVVWRSTMAATVGNRLELRWRLPPYRCQAFALQLRPDPG
ncbi:hypothetical protein GCM10010170_052960 [Dactylosporangium salmoneum]|uniref:Uncharacterized protein n=1 Tax=Dactylosporangium salmoneum TaxID=53361 RepID=A0ABN3GRL4_9ACTN